MRKLIFQDLSGLILLLVISAGAVPAQKDATPEAQRARLAKAEAMFKERCKTAGEKIYRTAANVEGILLIKVRPQKRNFSDQFAMDDPYGKDFGGDAYIMSFLRGFNERRKESVPGDPLRLGYFYVEALDPKDGQRYRYTGSIKDVEVKSSVLMGGDGKRTFVTKRFVLDKILASGLTSRYGVTYNDISTREEREYWIAGSSLKVMDLQTNQVMAERIGYMMDRGQGDTSGGRSPWLLAANYACPDFHRYVSPVVKEPGSSAQTHQTADFVEKVIKPKVEN